MDPNQSEPRTINREEATESLEKGKNNEEADLRLAQANKLYQTGVMLIYGKRKSVDKAIKCVQRAIVLNDTNYKYWQLLGEAYYQRGSLNPAINCFMKSLDRANDVDITEAEGKKRIQADCTFSKLRMSDIRLSVSHLDEAMRGYSDIVEFDPNNVAALVGLSKIELQFARNCFSGGLVESGHQHCISALKYALKTTKLSPHLCFTWKLASDCCLIQIIYGQRGHFESFIDVPDYPGVGEDGQMVLNRSICIELAIQFLCKALAVETYQKSACLWHNLGISLFLKATLVTSSAIIKEDQRKVLLKRSLKCLFKALDYDRISSQVRNSIGIVAFHLNLMNTSQSFIIKSIQTNMSTSEIQFSNLGYIYLQKGEFRLASVAFKRSQAEEPLYCRSWLGNALINDQNNMDNMTYLRHCRKLDNNYESQMMYSTKVTSLAHTKEFSKDLTGALDCMRRMINYDKQSLVAQNALGLLYERCNFSQQALNCFEQASILAPSDSRIIFNRLRQHNAHQSAGCVLDKNMASNLDTDFVKMAEKLADGSNRGYMLNFIYYLFKNSDYRNINSRLTKVIEKLPQEDVRSKISAQVLLAMADKMEGQDFKSWLFKNIIDSEGLFCIESVISLFCLMLFGSLANDQQLVGQVAGDLSKYLISYISTKSIQFIDLFNSLEGYWTRFLLLSSIFICHQNPGQLLHPLVVLFPTVPELWLYLGFGMLFQKSKKQVATFCIKKASLIGSTNANLSFVCDVLLAILSTNQESKQSKLQQSSALANRVVHLSRAIYRCPGYKLLWDCLEATRQRDAEESLNKKDKIFGVNDTNLFQLALDHTIQMISVQ